MQKVSAGSCCEHVAIPRMHSLENRTYLALVASMRGVTLLTRGAPTQSTAMSFGGRGAVHDCNHLQQATQRKGIAIRVSLAKAQDVRPERGAPCSVGAEGGEGRNRLHTRTCPRERHSARRAGPPAAPHGSDGRAARRARAQRQAGAGGHIARGLRGRWSPHCDHGEIATNREAHEVTLSPPASG